MTRPDPLTAGAEPDTLRWLITTAAFLLATIIVFAVIAALAWSAAVAGDVWGTTAYGGLAMLVLVMGLRKL
jgi:hypothetical protein